MTWINFLSYLAMGYAAYYLLIILMDSGPSLGNNSESSPVLTFSEHIEPEKIGLEDYGKGATAGKNSSGSGSVALGGVSIKDLFELARKDAIEFTKSVSF
jgi:hypothetical protein